MDAGDLLKKVKKGSEAAAEIVKLKVKQSSLERRITKLHTYLGERVDYLFSIEKSDIGEDEVVKGFIEEIKDVRNELNEISAKIEQIKSELKEGDESKEEEESQETPAEDSPAEKGEGDASGQ